MRMDGGANASQKCWEGFSTSAGNIKCPILLPLCSNLDVPLFILAKYFRAHFRINKYMSYDHKGKYYVSG